MEKHEWADKAKKKTRQKDRTVRGRKKGEGREQGGVSNQRCKDKRTRKGREPEGNGDEDKGRVRTVYVRGREEDGEDKS